MERHRHRCAQRARLLTGLRAFNAARIQVPLQPVSLLSLIKSTILLLTPTDFENLSLPNYQVPQQIATMGTSIGLSLSPGIVVGSMLDFEQEWPKDVEKVPLPIWDTGENLKEHALHISLILTFILRQALA